MQDGMFKKLCFIALAVQIVGGAVHAQQGVDATVVTSVADDACNRCATMAYDALASSRHPTKEQLALCDGCTDVKVVMRLVMEQAGTSGNAAIEQHVGLLLQQQQSAQALKQHPQYGLYTIVKDHSDFIALSSASAEDVRGVVECALTANDCGTALKVYDQMRSELTETSSTVQAFWQRWAPVVSHAGCILIGAATVVLCQK